MERKLIRNCSSVRKTTRKTKGGKIQIRGAKTQSGEAGSRDESRPRSAAPHIKASTGRTFYKNEKLLLRACTLVELASLAEWTENELHRESQTKLRLKKCKSARKTGKLTKEREERERKASEFSVSLFESQDV